MASFTVRGYVGYMRPCVVIAAVCLALGACSTVHDVSSTVRDVREKPLNPQTMDHPEKEGVVGAAEAPFEDVNVIRTQIPPVLLRAEDAPYARPDPPSCGQIARDVEDLDDALGDDYDAPPPPTEGRAERNGRVAGEAAVTVMRDTELDFIPFRSWVRRLSGAQRHANEVRAAVYAGRVRRAYLKGLGEALRCTFPAAPYGASPLPVAPDPAPRASRKRRR